MIEFANSMQYDGLPEFAKSRLVFSRPEIIGIVSIGK